MSDKGNNKENFEKVALIMKKTHFWKYVAFGTNCIKQEFVVYEQLAKDRFFDMSKFLKKTVERFWKAAATGYSMDEQYILAVEESFFVPRDGWEELALQFVQDLHDFFYAVLEKDDKKALDMQERQISFIEKYAEVAGLTFELVQPWIEKAHVNHLNMAKELVGVVSKDKKHFLEEFSNRTLESLLGDDFLSARPERKPEKPAKKKLAEIRVTSLDFDKEKEKYDNSWLKNSTPNQWVLGREADINQKGAYADYYREKDFVDLCYVMDVRYRLYAEADYIANRLPERVRGFWYLNALTWLRAYQLRQKGFPVKWVPYFESHENGDEGFQPVFSKMLSAYASGEDWLLPEIQYFSSNKEKAKTAPLLQLMIGGSSQEIYPQVEAWEECERKKIVLAILKEDKTESRKLLLQRIRHDRQMYDMYRTMVDFEAYAFLRLAMERGIEMEQIVAAEVLDGNLTMSPLDKGYFQLPFQKEIEEWLLIH
ncbi:MAG: hypothetical protein IJX63_10285 [Lachnospiraceae bacterium]|nr:hypothetical protein [Lachnospiraceae bacterium]